LNITKDILPLIQDLNKEQLEELYAFLGDYETQPVTIQEFIESPEFMGPYWEDGFWPYWMDVYKKIFPSPFYSPYYLCLAEDTDIEITVEIVQGGNKKSFRQELEDSYLKNIGLNYKDRKIADTISSRFTLIEFVKKIIEQI